MKTTQGFTLIELLVVIAIIGILSSVVLTSLSSARGKGLDAASKAETSSIRAQAEIWADSNNALYNTNGAAKSATCSGGAACANCTALAGTIFADATVTQLMNSINRRQGDFACNASADGSQFAVAFAEKAASGKWWCMDNTSGGKERSAALAGPTC